MPRHLLLVLEGPLQSWGGVIVDAYGRIDDFPPASLIVGLLANAVGWYRTDADRLQALQARLVMGSAVVRRGHLLTDHQNAKLGKDDRGWTTRGRPESRTGGADSYESPHRRFRDFAADAAVLVAVRLDPPEPSPTLDDLERALAEPARPLFLGRKSCAPARPLLTGMIDAETVVDALETGITRLRAAEGVSQLLRVAMDQTPVPARWPVTEGDRPGSRIVEVWEERDWLNDVHVGSRRRRVAALDIAPLSQGSSC